MMLTIGVTDDRAPVSAGVDTVAEQLRASGSAAACWAGCQAEAQAVAVGLHSKFEWSDGMACATGAMWLHRDAVKRGNTQGRASDVKEGRTHCRPGTQSAADRDGRGAIPRRSLLSARDHWTQRLGHTCKLSRAPLISQFDSLTVIMHSDNQWTLIKR